MQQRWFAQTATGDGTAQDRPRFTSSTRAERAAVLPRPRTLCRRCSMSGSWARRPRSAGASRPCGRTTSPCSRHSAARLRLSVQVKLLAYQSVGDEQNFESISSNVIIGIHFQRLSTRILPREKLFTKVRLYFPSNLSGGRRDFVRLHGFGNRLRLHRDHQYQGLDWDLPENIIHNSVTA